MVWYFSTSLRTVRDMFGLTRFGVGIEWRVCKARVLRSSLCDRSLAIFSSSLDFEKLRRSFSPTLLFQSLSLVVFGVFLMPSISQRVD